MKCLLVLIAVAASVTPRAMAEGEAVPEELFHCRSSLVTVGHIPAEYEWEVYYVDAELRWHSVDSGSAGSERARARRVEAALARCESEIAGRD